MRHGIVGDIHEPFAHPMYRVFCLDVFDSWGVDAVTFIGDVVDFHAVTFHTPDPNGMSAGYEADAAAVGVAKWREAFPKARVCIGNHDERVFRVARSVGIPDRFIKSYADVWETPGWTWDFDFEIDGVLLQHGTNTSGKFPAFNQAMTRRQPVAQGHNHSAGGVKFHASRHDRIFGMDTGCGIDDKAYAMAYGKTSATRSVLGCGVIIDGAAYFEPMPCGEGEKYHRNRAKRRAA